MKSLSTRQAAWAVCVIAVVAAVGYPIIRYGPRRTQIQILEGELAAKQRALSEPSIDVDDSGSGARELEAKLTAVGRNIDDVRNSLAHYDALLDAARTEEDETQDRIHALSQLMASAGVRLKENVAIRPGADEVPGLSPLAEVLIQDTGFARRLQRLTFESDYRALRSLAGGLQELAPRVVVVHFVVRVSPAEDESGTATGRETRSALMETTLICAL